ncbi:MAG: GNAT family N-acetyltransferase [Mastigocoleus sp. MO_167.B18]|nr:GNAT family N-acetyltransferase [Mastigocoleus sp. MO_167.B18]
MFTSIINRIEEFDKLKTAWNQVYDSDKHAQVFLSWSWLRGWLEVNSDEWLILALQSDQDSGYIAFFPIVIHSWKWNGVKLYRALHTAGDPLADHRGFVCLPEFEEEAIQNFATYIQENLEWDHFQIQNILDSQLSSFLKYFRKDKFHIESIEEHSYSYIPLPSSWEEYLKTFLGPKARKNVRHALRQVEKQSNIHLEETHRNNFKTQLDALLKLMQMQRGSQPKSLLNMYRDIFQRCAENNNLWLSVLWDQKKPIAATGMFVDLNKKRAYGYMTGYNSEYSKLSPGRVMMAYSIKKAIDNNFQIYDFLRGSEEYKFSFFGAQKYFNTSCQINRKTMKSDAIKALKKIKDISIYTTNNLF